MSIVQRCRAENTFNLVSMSGGKDSLAQCLYAIENDIQHERVFADTGHEHPQTMEYLDYLEQKLGPIRRVKADFTRQIEGKRKFIAEKWPVSLVAECGMTPDEEWRSADLRKILMELAKDGAVSKDTYASRIGQAVWRLEVR